MQRWGQNLGSVGEAAAQVAKARELAEEADRVAREYEEAFRESYGQVADQGTNGELPTDPRLASEVESVRNRANQATTAEEWRGVAADASTLPTLYGYTHAADEDRLTNPRGGPNTEARADSLVARQDT